MRKLFLRSLVTTVALITLASLSCSNKQGSANGEIKADTECNLDELKKQIGKAEELEDKLDDDLQDSVRRLNDAAETLQKSIQKIRDANFDFPRPFDENRKRYLEALKTYGNAQHAYVEQLSQGISADQADAASNLSGAKSAMETARDKLLEGLTKQIQLNEELDKKAAANSPKKKLQDLNPEEPKPPTTLETLKKLESGFLYDEEEYHRLSDEYEKRDVYWKQAKAKRIALEKQLEEAEKKCAKRVPPDSPRIDHCLVGEWRTAAVTGRVTGGSGFRLTIRDDGTQIVDYSSMEILRLQDLTYRYRGSAEGMFLTTQEDVAKNVSITKQSVTLAMGDINGEKAAQPSQGMGPGALGTNKNNNRYTCTDRTLSYQTEDFKGNVFLVITMQRVTEK